MKTKVILEKKSLIKQKKSILSRNKIKNSKRKTTLLKKEILQYFDKNGYLSWSAERKKYVILGTNEPKNGLVPCPKCKIGQLMIIRSPKTKKRFMGCSNYYNGCTVSSPLLQKAMMRATKIRCDACQWPFIYFRYTRKAKWIRRCSNFYCSSKIKN